LHINLPSIVTLYSFRATAGSLPVNKLYLHPRSRVPSWR
jgi:hypothetical protein